MPKKERLARKADFRKVFKEGKRFSSPHFSLYTRNTDRPVSRFACSVAKAHVKLATRRNRLRRVAREEFRVSLASDGQKRDVIIASKKNPGEKTTRMEETSLEIRQLMQRAKKEPQSG